MSEADTARGENLATESKLRARVAQLEGLIEAISDRLALRQLVEQKTSHERFDYRHRDATLTAREVAEWRG